MDSATQIQNPLRRHALLLTVCLVYLGIALTYSHMTGAWEANDEMDHVANTEYIVQHRTLYPLRIEKWHETHQPPLYYMVEAAWQRLLKIPPFTPSHPATTRPTVNDDPVLVYTHVYDREEYAAAAALHKLRLLSVMFGLITVLLTYAAGRLVTRDEDLAVASAAFVALLPRFDVVSSVFTNDALVIALCSLGLVIALAYRRYASAKTQLGLPLVFAFGMTAGAALLTKLNSVPVMSLLLGYILMWPKKDFAMRCRNAAVAIVGFAAVAGWWLLRNYRMTGDPLGQAGVTEWLNSVLPGNVFIVSWTDSERFLNFVPARLVRSFWYQGGWNQFFAPFGINFFLSCLAAISIFGVCKALLNGGQQISKGDSKISLLFAAAVTGFGTVFLLAKAIGQGEGRIAYVGLSAFAILCVVGMTEALGVSPARVRYAIAFWPTVLFLFNLYVFFCFILPLRAF